MGQVKRSGESEPGYRRDVEAVVADLVREFSHVRSGTMFGVPAFYSGRKLFACVYGAGVGIKLPEESIRRLRGPHFAPFQPYDRPPMREWIEIRRPKAADYRRDHELFRQSAEFVRESNTKERGE